LVAIAACAFPKRHGRTNNLQAAYPGSMARWQTWAWPAIDGHGIAGKVWRTSKLNVRSDVASFIYRAVADWWASQSTA